MLNERKERDMKIVRLFSISMIAMGSAFLSACGPQEAEVAPPPAVEEVDQEAQGVETGVEQEAQGVETEVEQEAQGVETEVEQGTDPRFDALEGFTLEQRAEFEQELNTMIQDFDVRIADLEAQAPTLDEATQTQLNDEIAALRQQQGLLQQQLGQLLGGVTEENWQDVKTGILTAIEAFEQSVQEAESRVG
jgi:hypothetical protein